VTSVKRALLATSYASYAWLALVTINIAGIYFEEAYDIFFEHDVTRSKDGLPTFSAHSPIDATPVCTTRGHLGV
jgi:hypothetical protein